MISSLMPQTAVLDITFPLIFPTQGSASALYANLVFVYVSTM